MSDLTAEELRTAAKVARHRGKPFEAEDLERYADVLDPKSGTGEGIEAAARAMAIEWLGNDADAWEQISEHGRAQWRSVALVARHHLRRAEASGPVEAVLVFETEAKIEDDRRERLASYIREQLPNYRAIILQDGLHFCGQIPANAQPNDEQD